MKVRRRRSLFGRGQQPRLLTLGPPEERRGWRIVADWSHPWDSLTRIPWKRKAEWQRKAYEAAPKLGDRKLAA